MARRSARRRKRSIKQNHAKEAVRAIRSRVCAPTINPRAPVELPVEPSAILSSTEECMGEIDLIIAMIVGAGLVIVVGGGASHALAERVREPHQKAPSPTASQVFAALFCAKPR